MQKILGIGLTPIVVIFAGSAVALTVQEIPNPRQTSGGWVTDMANVLSPATEAEINQLITELEAENGSEMAVVTVPETAPSATPKAFATELFNTWGIGKADRDNGVLFLISVGDQRAEIETGYGIEKILPDEQVSEILEQAVIPHYKNGNYDQGTLAGTQALAEALGDRESDNWLLASVLLLLLLVLGGSWGFVGVFIGWILVCAFTGWIIYGILTGKITQWLLASVLLSLSFGSWGFVGVFLGWTIYGILTGKGIQTWSSSSFNRTCRSRHDRDSSSDFGGGESGGGGSGSDW